MPSMAGKATGAAGETETTKDFARLGLAAAAKGQQGGEAKEDTRGETGARGRQR